VFFSTAIPNFY